MRFSIKQIPKDSRIAVIALAAMLGVVAIAFLALVAFRLIDKGFELRRNGGSTPAVELRTERKS